MLHSEYSNGWNSAAAILVTFKVSMNKTPVPPPLQLDYGWSRRLYPGDVQRVREADCFMKPCFHNSYNIRFILADKISKFTSLVV